MNQLSFFENKSKVELAIERIREFEPQEGYYLAFSGGKDSICCYQLLKMSGVKFDSHYNVTGLDHPELIYNMKKHYPDVKFEYPRDRDGEVITMWKLIEKKLMPPTRLVRYCCSELKEKGGEGRFVVTGVRWAESSRRKNTRSAIENFHKNKKYQIHSNDNDKGRMMLENCIKKGKFILNPIIDWEDKDVWDFIKSQGLKYPSLYDEGMTRLGCIGCPNMGHEKQKEELKKYPKFRLAYIKAFEKMLKQREIRGKETTWKTAEEVMVWWLMPPSKHKELDNQLTLFKKKERWRYYGTYKISQR